MTNLNSALETAINYISPTINIPNDVLLASTKFYTKAVDDSLESIGAKYHDVITQSLITFFEGGNATPSRNAFKRGTTEVFVKAFDLGWLDGGRDLPLDAEALLWFNARLEAEYGFIGSLFEQAKELRKENDFDFFTWVTQKADSYVKTLASIYNSARMFAKKNQLLTWRLGDTEVHCATCLKLNGGSHRASWYLSRNYIPRQPNADMDCKGYNCDCYLETKDGEFVTI